MVANSREEFKCCNKQSATPVCITSVTCTTSKATLKTLLNLVPLDILVLSEARIQIKEEQQLEDLTRS